MQNIFSQAASRRRFYRIWRRVKEGKKLQGEEALLGKLMQRHQEYYNTWEFADVTAESPYDMETEENPFLHVTLHAVVENQIKQNDSPGVRIVLNQLTAKGHSQHEAVHEIARVLVEEIWQTLRYYRPFDSVRYVRKLQRLRRRK